MDMSAEEMKEKLLELARLNQKRPHSHKTKMGQWLCRFTCRAYENFDAKFNVEIRKLAPTWFCKKGKNSKKLLELARKKRPKPTKKNLLLYNALHNYTSPSSQAYDVKLDRELRALSPHWFMTLEDRRRYFEAVRVEKKKEILDLARSTEKHLKEINKKLARTLQYATLKSSKHYDAGFDRMIRELKPEWFAKKTSRSAALKKEKLIELANSGASRPTCRHELGRFLTYYTAKSTHSYDLDFDQKIRKLRPDWFSVIETARREKKDLLLELAKRGESRPQLKVHPLGFALNSFTNKQKKSYDREFDKEIRKLAPDWFLNIAALKKKKLLDFAKDGKDKAFLQTEGMLQPFRYYTKKSSKYYDVELDLQLQKLCPHWY